MGALDSLKPDFALSIRSKGKEYFLENHVELLKSEPGLLKARVNGSDEYRVEIRWSSHGVAYACSCPFFQDRDEPCKHIWASLLEADHEGSLELAAGRIGQTIARPAVDGPLTRLPLWKQQLARLGQRLSDPPSNSQTAKPVFPHDRKLLYAIDLRRSLGREDGTIVLRLFTRRLTRTGRFGQPRRFSLSLDQWLAVPDEPDRTIARLIAGVKTTTPNLPDASIELSPHAWPETIKLIVESGRCYVFDENRIVGSPLKWDGDNPWRFEIEVKPDARANGHHIVGSLRRGDEVAMLHSVDLVVPQGYAVFAGRVAKVDDGGAPRLLSEMLAHDDLIVPADGIGDVLDELLKLPQLPPLNLPESIGIPTVEVAPKPILRIDSSAGEFLRASAWFEYGGVTVDSSSAHAVVFDPNNRQLVQRDRSAELKRLGELDSLGIRHEAHTSTPGLRRLRIDKLPHIVLVLGRHGWRVEAEGKSYRSPGRIEAAVKSGIDWFDLTAKVEFGTTSIAFPRLLEAVHRGEKSIVLDDGSIGVLPEEWLARFSAFAGAAELVDGTHLRFKKTQAALLDAMLAAMPQASVDEVFETARRQLASFEGITPLDPPESFVGTLRAYQREGLGWLKFLETFGFGGCLADDMGLGKTIQVLALLDARRREAKSTSLVVVPRSLVFNWISEANKFTPELKLLDHSGPNRTGDPKVFSEFDVVVTTYGTLRRDITMLRSFSFDYVILDESQAIKNASTASAKAARLLRGKHRLAMSGTPVENHLGELWSLFDFLNPGMLGGSSVFRSITSNGEAGAESRQMIARAIRPLVLRRTKRQVASELPERVEQNLVCDLPDEQRKLYTELREHYRQALSGKQMLDDSTTRMQVLEALLRLRQAACHPGLIDPRYASRPTAKFEALLAKLAEVDNEGAKALVFSQFTRLLALLRPRLEQRRIKFTYLDGKTRDRQSVVDQFQNDPSTRVMLISLKAGGVGLNLTAAEYVFLLDPWWNPAVEAQAIDRAHRIGQTRTVFAYRLIARDTVEDKVLQLQKSKRDLAASIIGDDNALPAQLTSEDLMTLLS